MNQDALVFVIVAAAVAYLAWTWWRASRGEKGCGGCSGACGKTPQSTLGASQAPIQIQMNGRALHLSPRENQGNSSTGKQQTSKSSH